MAYTNEIVELTPDEESPTTITAFIYEDGVKRVEKSFWPNGIVFSSKEEAQAWADQMTEILNNPTTAALNPQEGPNLERTVRKINIS